MIEIVNKICAQLPPGWRIELCMAPGDEFKNRAWWITLIDPQGWYASLPDARGKTIVEQLEDTLLVAKGWRDTP
jgi:hypothetical protein